MTRCGDDVRETIEKRLQGKKDFVYIRKRATPAEAQRVAAERLPGVGFMKESRRYYPNRDLASALIGFVDAKNHGVGGLELVHNTLVTGTGGTLIVQHDAQQHVIATMLREAPTPGVTLELTIDARLQFIAERELRAAVEEHGAIGGTVVMMDPHTGEILALVSEPHFNPNDSSKVDRASRVNRAVETIYEPGSTFKTITAAAALEEDVIKPTDIVDATMPCRFGTAKAITDVHQVGVVSFEKVFAKSSNCGTARVAVNRLGTERLMRYVKRFGFGVRATRDFPAESGGMVMRVQDIKEHDLARVAIGYTIAVTPLQMAAAMSAIANGGELIKPRIVRATISGTTRTPTVREVTRRAISTNTAARLTTMMEAVVEAGTAKAARIEGYTLAAKTGTARKLNPNGRGYLMEYMASTAGFFPSRNPAVAMIVVIDAPKRKGYFGGAVAAPVFQRIADATLRHLAIAPNVNRQPPIVVARGTDGPSIAPVSHDRREGPQLTAAGDSAMPDLAGLSAREAVRALIELGWEPRLRGQGAFVARQSVPGGNARGPGRCVPARPGPLPGRARDARRGRTLMARRTLADLVADVGAPHAAAGPGSRGRGRSRRDRHRVRLANGHAGRGVRGPARRAARRHRVRGAGHPAGRDRRRGRPRGRGRAGRALDRRRTGTRGARGLRGHVLRAPQRSPAPRRRHRHQRQDDLDLPSRRRVRGLRMDQRPDRHHGLPHRHRRAARPRVPRRRRQTSRPCCARWWTAGAAPARWRCPRTRSISSG